MGTRPGRSSEPRGPGGEPQAGLPSGEWQPIDVELERDGFLARVTRTVRIGGTRWRWSVTPVDVAERWKTKVVEHAYSRGYCKGYERALRMAEAAIEALKAASGAP